MSQPKTTVASNSFNFIQPISLGSTAAAAAPSGGLFSLPTTSSSTGNGGFNFNAATTGMSTTSSGLTSLFSVTGTAGGLSIPTPVSTASSSFAAMPNSSSSSVLGQSGSFSFSSGSTEINVSKPSVSSTVNLFTLPISNPSSSQPNSLTLSISSTSAAPISSVPPSSLSISKATGTSLTLPTTAIAATLSTATTTSSTFGTSGVPIPNLSMRQLEERLNKWLLELKEQEERFIQQAAHVNSWDQILQNGHDQVQALKDTVHTVKADQFCLEAELDFIRSQQDELERLLDPLECAVSSTPASQMHQGDRQRDNMYHLAQNLDGQLRQMTDDLAKVIEHLNSNSPSVQTNDPVSLVARILSAHMDTLKWVDHNTSVLFQKTEQISKLSSDVNSR